MNPLVARGQEQRLPQPTAPLDAREISRCHNAIDKWQKLHAKLGPVAILTYLTDGAALSPWLLGLSAAARGVPLVVAGNGRRWAGAAIKLPAARRAVQALAAHAPPDIAVIFADGADTAIANPVTRDTRATLRAFGARNDQVLVSGECNSWPKCYKDSYRRHTAFSTCRATRSPACYPNSGLYMGSARSLLRFLRRLDERAKEPSLVRPERGDDQAAMHALYVRQGQAAWNGDGDARHAESVSAGPSEDDGSVQMVVDSAQTVFGGLHACKGGGAPRRLLIRGTNFSLCHEGAHEPLRHLVRNSTGIQLCVPAASAAAAAASLGTLSTRPRPQQPAPPRSVSGCGPGDDMQRPLLLHASGNHERMARAFLGESYLHELGASIAMPATAKGRAAAVERRWHQTFAAATGGGLGALLSHPVLLIDAAPAVDGGAGGAHLDSVCEVTTLRALSPSPHDIAVV